MKSAYELAMERLGGTKRYSDAHKARLAEIDARYEAKRAEARLGADGRLAAAAGDAAKADEIAAQLAAELRRLDAKCEAEKDAVRAES